MTTQLFFWKGGQKIATVLSGPHPLGGKEYRFQIDQPILDEDELEVRPEDASAAVMRVLSSGYEYHSGLHYISVAELSYGTNVS